MKIETSRLILREPRVNDFNEFWLMINDPIAKEFTGGVTFCTFEERLTIFEKECQNFMKDHNLEFSVIEKTSNKYIGYCGFRYCDLLNGIELLYGYCQSSWGKGYGYEAAKCAMEFGFSVINLENIVAAVNPLNIASEKILQKLGMKYIEKIDWPNQGLVNKYAMNNRESSTHSDNG